MRIKIFAAAIATIIAGVVFLFPEGTAAQTSAVRILASNGVQGALQEVTPECERVIGHSLAVEFNTTATLKPRIEGGEAFDLTVLTSEAIVALAKEGKIAPGSRANIARVGIGVGIRKGAGKPDVSTREALKKTLLNAKSITYAEAGASRPTVDKLLAELGIADAVKAKTLLLPGAEQTTEAVASGKADILLTLISEIVSAKGMELAGPLPKEFQNYITFAVGVSPNASNPEAAKATVKFLTGAKAAAAYQAKGMDPVK